MGGRRRSAKDNRVRSNVAENWKPDLAQIAGKPHIRPYDSLTWAKCQAPEPCPDYEKTTDDTARRWSIRNYSQQP
jgi:hypothetical protein